MNIRKQQVINKAHELFNEKGFQSTSIQDILEYSGISKGTFYNYFASKNELLMAIISSVFKKIEHDRNELLIGQDRSNIEIFIKQIELQLYSNRSKNLISLFEEIVVTNDKDLKIFMRKHYVSLLNWLLERFRDIFGVEKEPYLLDCSIMFLGILQHNLKFNKMINSSNSTIKQIVRYSVERMKSVVEEVAQSGEQLIEPKIFHDMFQNYKLHNKVFQNKLGKVITQLKQHVCECKEDTISNHIDLLDFIQDELLHAEQPRKFLIDSALLSLKINNIFINSEEINQLEKLLNEYLK